MARYQVSFDKDADLEIVEKQLLQLTVDWNTEGTDWTVVTGFIPRDIIEAKGWSTAIHDMFDRVIPLNKIYHENGTYDTLEECMANIDNTRSFISATTSRLYVLGVKMNPGVVAEINERSSEPIIFPPVI